MKRVFLFIGFVAVITLASFHFANAETLEDKDRNWHICADAEVAKFLRQDPEKINMVLCEKVMNAKQGPECNQQAELMIQLGILDVEVNKFLLAEVVQPICGVHPEAQ